MTENHSLEPEPAPVTERDHHQIRRRALSVAATVLGFAALALDGLGHPVLAGAAHAAGFAARLLKTVLDAHALRR